MRPYHLPPKMLFETTFRTRSQSSRTTHPESFLQSCLNWGTRSMRIRSHCIQVVHPTSQILFSANLWHHLDSYDFCMCNPPFYKDEQDIYDSQSSKTDLPATTCLGSENEMMTEGGEVQFVTQMIQESMVLKDAVRYVSANACSWSSGEATSLRALYACSPSSVQ